MEKERQVLRHNTQSTFWEPDSPLQHDESARLPEMLEQALSIASGPWSDCLPRGSTNQRASLQYEYALLIAHVVQNKWLISVADTLDSQGLYSHLYLGKLRSSSTANR